MPRPARVDMVLKLNNSVDKDNKKFTYQPHAMIYNNRPTKTISYEFQ